jgi:hypothetical protein
VLSRHVRCCAERRKSFGRQTLEEIRKDPDYVRLPSSKMVKVSLSLQAIGSSPLCRPKAVPLRERAHDCRMR